MSSNAAVMWSVKSMNNGRKESTSLSPVSLCCTNLNLGCFTDPTQSDNIKATRPYEQTNCSSCSTFKQAAIRRLHCQKVWKLYPRLATWMHMISSASWSTTTCKVSLSVGLNPSQLCTCAGVWQLCPHYESVCGEQPTSPRSKQTCNFHWYRIRLRKDNQLESAARSIQFLGRGCK